MAYHIMIARATAKIMKNAAAPKQNQNQKTWPESRVLKIISLPVPKIAIDEDP